MYNAHMKKDIFFWSAATFVASWLIQLVLTFFFPMPSEVLDAHTSPTSSALGLLAAVLSAVAGIVFLSGLFLGRR